jgi:hypothetical protein
VKKNKKEFEIKYMNLLKAFEYLVSRLPEDCTAGFVTHARAIASGNAAEIERTK